MDVTSIVWYMTLVCVIDSRQFCITSWDDLSMDCYMDSLAIENNNNTHNNKIKNIKILGIFKTLKANTFQFPNLTDITIRNARLKTIEPSAFNNLPKLNSLQLGTNNIATIKKGVFNNLTNLELLDLSHNNIQFIEDNSFAGANIKKLSLKFNEIENMSSVVENCEYYEDLNLRHNHINIISSLRDCKRLRVLNIGDNNIIQLRNKHFPISLTSLDLTHNDIERVETETFAEMAQLNYLNLAENNLYKLSSGSIPLQLLLPLTGLTTLDLSHNGLSHLFPGTFAKLTSLTSLNLGFNYLNKLSNGLLNDLPLEYLSIRRNLFTNLEDNFFNNEYRITINLADNPWPCDYLFNKIAKIIRMNPNNKIINANTIKCINTKVNENDATMYRTPNNQTTAEVPKDSGRPVEDFALHQISALEERTIQTEKSQFVLMAVLVALWLLTVVISIVAAFLVYKSKRTAQIKNLQQSLLDSY